MTSSRYFIALFAKAFGYVRRAHRMGDAASEMHLLREAEAQLGGLIWQNVENIEALSVEYWNLRKLIKERDLVRAKLDACQERLDRAHEERAELLNSAPETNLDLLNERTALLAELEELSHQRDQVVADAREVRRIYVGLKMKLEVLTKESTGSPPNHEEILKVQTRLVELKGRFSELKQQRIHIGEAIEKGDTKLDVIDEQFKEQRQERRIQASAAFQVIGEGNREISIMRAESGLLDTRMRQLYGEIGRYVSRHANQDAACAAASSQYHGLIDVMRALRRSIALNHRLAGTA
jgi:chromosome segregation ATPase